MRVNRFDVAELGKPARTPQGFLRVPAFVTRAGVFVYRRADGSVVREFRPPEEVFREDSLATLFSAPVTELHPTEMVTPVNVRKLRIGGLAEMAGRHDGHRVGTALTVEPDDSIKKVEKKELCEVSMGYQCRIDATPGVWNGEAYDVVQRDIVYNHAALGPKNWGRQGRDIALRVDSGEAPQGDDKVFRLDSSDAVNATTFEAPPERRDNGHDAAGGNMSEVMIRVDGIEVQVPKQWGQLLEQALKKRDDSITALTGERDSLQGKFDAQATEVAELKKKLTDATDAKRLDAAVNARAALLEQAKRVLPAEHKFDGQTSRQIHEAVLKKLDDKLDLAGKSDEYVGARFDHAMDTFGGDKSTSRNDALDHARRTTSSGGNNPPPPQQRTDAAPQLADWQKPLSATKDGRN